MSYESHEKQFVWEKITPEIKELCEKDRPLQLCRPCTCGCEGRKGVGYITGGVGYEGMTIWIDEEEVYQMLSKVFKKHKLKVEK